MSAGGGGKALIQKVISAFFKAKAGINFTQGTCFNFPQVCRSKYY